MPRRPFLPLLAICAVLAALPARADDGLACLTHARGWEARYGLPEHLVVAVATAESGRALPGRNIRLPWPWTINADGKGYYFATKDEAVTAARRLQAAGARNLDIGCMQISLRAHPNAFASLDEAFDPQANTRYGAQFLRSLWQELGALPQAVGSYHSRTPELLAEYRDRVLGIWRRLVGNQPILAVWHTPSGIRAASTAPEYPDREARRLDPVEALGFYRTRLGDGPDNGKAAFGLAVALDRMARLRLMPQAQARIAYAQALRADPRNAEALGRLLELVALEEPQQQFHQLEQAYLISGGPAALVEQLAEIAGALGRPDMAANYREQAKRLKAMRG